MGVDLGRVWECQGTAWAGVIMAWEGHAHGFGSGFGRASDRPANSLGMYALERHDIDMGTTCARLVYGMGTTGAQLGQCMGRACERHGTICV